VAVITAEKFDEVKGTLEQCADWKMAHAEVDNEGILVAIRGNLTHRSPSL
jgi:hypothetical protein